MVPMPHMDQSRSAVAPDLRRVRFSQQNRIGTGVKFAPGQSSALVGRMSIQTGSGSFWNFSSHLPSLISAVASLGVLPSTLRPSGTHVPTMDFATALSDDAYDDSNFVLAMLGTVRQLFMVFKIFSSLPTVKMFSW